MTVQILVVDDDIPLAKTLGQLLQEAGYEPLVAHTAEDGLRLVLSHKPKLALLDVMVPSMGGWELCRQIRRFSDMPIIFLTALGNVEHVVRGLELGADDYLVKPVQPAEFTARIMAHLRRLQQQTAVANPEKYILDDGKLIIDLAARQVLLRGEEVNLTGREFELLTVFTAHVDQVITTADLVEQAWGMTDKAAVDNLKPYIHYLRKKLEEDPAAPRYIQTIRGVGYRFTNG